MVRSSTLTSARKKIKKREERKKAKEQKKRARMEKRANTAKSTKKVSAATTGTTGKGLEGSKTTTPDKKAFVPAPPPPVSAWKSGPPPGFKTSPAVNSVRTNGEVPLWHDQDNTQRPASSGIVESLMGNSSPAPNQFGAYANDSKDNARSWSDTKEHPSHVSSVSQNPSVSPISLSMTTGVSTWNAFSGPSSALGIHPFGPPQVETNSSSTDWGMGQGIETETSHRKLNLWTETSAGEDATEEDVDTMAIEGAVVPSDLLSSSPDGSVVENVAATTNETDAGTERRGSDRKRRGGKRAFKGQRNAKTVGSRRRKKVFPKPEDGGEESAARKNLESESAKHTAAPAKPQRGSKSRPRSGSRRSSEKRTLPRRATRGEEEGKPSSRKPPSRPKAGGRGAPSDSEAPRVRKPRRSANQRSRRPRGQQQQQQLETTAAFS